MKPGVYPGFPFLPVPAVGLRNDGQIEGFGAMSAPEHGAKSSDGTQPGLHRSWGAVVFAAALAVAMLFYAWSVMDVARRITDWLLILPVAIIGAVAAFWAAAGDLKKAARHLSQLSRRRLSDEARPIALIVLTCGYVLAAPYLGFDIATAVFILVTLMALGERSWWKLVLAAIPGAALLTWIFTRLLLVRLPVLVF